MTIFMMSSHEILIEIDWQLEKWWSRLANCIWIFFKQMVAHYASFETFVNVGRFRWFQNFRYERGQCYYYTKIPTIMKIRVWHNMPYTILFFKIPEIWMGCLCLFVLQNIPNYPKHACVCFSVSKYTKIL